MILIFFKNGEPKISVSMMETKDKNPKPMNSGDPQLKKTTSARVLESYMLWSTYGSGRGAEVVGQSAKIPLVGRF
jgi:hypothetical protein